MTSLRPATATDWPAIQALLQASGLPLDGAQAHLANYLVVDGEAGALAACAGMEVHGSAGLLRSVAVAPAAQGQGTARRLVRRLVTDAMARGLDGLYLLTTSAPDYFSRLGFARQAVAEAPAGLRVSAEFQGACPASAVFMALALPKPWLRMACADDAPAITAIYAPIVRDTCISFELEPPTGAQMRERIAATLPRLPWLVSLDATGQVNGYAYASKHRERAAYQWAVDVSAYVRADTRGQGVGALLYRRLLAMLAAQGYFQAFAGIALPNAASVALHESVGFAPLGVYRNVGFKLGRWHDVGWWQCALRPPENEPAAPRPTAPSAAG